MKRILIVVPFEKLYPPMNGGMLRGMNLLHQLARHFEVTAIIHQDETSFLKAVADFPAIKHCTIISTKNVREKFNLFSLLPSRLASAVKFRYWNRSLKGPAEGNFLRMYPALKNVLQRQAFEYVILEDMAILNMSKIIRRCQPKARIIYDAYNVNTRLAKAKLDSGHIDRRAFEMVKQAESNLAVVVDSVFTCSEQDLLELNKMNGGRLQGTVVPNGVGIERGIDNQPTVTADDILFCGSLDYLPNKEGLAWFCREVFPLLLQQKPSVRLMVVGKGDRGEELRTLLKHDAIIYYGMVEKVSDYYKKTAIAIVPLLSGSGTRLKLLEAMGNKVAVVSTTVGAEGIDYTDQKNIIIADDPLSFANVIATLLNDKKTTANMAQEALLFVKEKYDWNVIGNHLFNYLQNYR